MPSNIMIASSALLSSPTADCGHRTLRGEIYEVQNKYAVSQAMESIISSAVFLDTTSLMNRYDTMACY